MEPFTRLAKRVGMDDQLPAVARLVFAALDSALDKQTGHCSPTLAGLAAWVGRGPRAVQRAIGRLEAAGYVAVARSSGRRNAYRLLPTPDNFDPGTPVKNDTGTPVKNDTGTPVKNDTGTPVKNDTGSAAPFRMSELRTKREEQAPPPRPADLFHGHYRDWFTSAVRYHLGDRPDLAELTGWFPALAADFFLTHSWHRTSDPETAVGWARRLAAIGATETETADAFGWALGSPGIDATGRKVFSRPDHLARIAARVQSQRRRHGGRSAEGPITEVPTGPAEPRPDVPAEVLATVRRRFPDLVPDGLHFRREVLAELARAGGEPMNLYDDLPDPEPVEVPARPAGQVLAGLCADKAEAGGWDRDAAAAFVLEYLEAYGPTSGEVIVTAASQLYRPHDGRAYGAIFGTLSRRGIIRKAGYTERVQKGHGAPGAVIWELAPD